MRTICECSKNIEERDGVVIIRRCVCWCEPVLTRPRSERRNRSQRNVRRNRPQTEERRNHRSNCHIEGISLQLTTLDEKELPSKCPLIFNERLTDNSRFINYHDETGMIEICRHGMYLIDWDVVAKGTSQEDAFVCFGLEVNGEVTASSTVPASAGQLNGRALLHVDQVPTTVKLINEADEPVQLSTFTPIANLRVVAVE